MNLSDIKRIYFIGIGGIGMSALARYFLGRGCEVAGYDRTETELTKQLEQEGMNIHYVDDISLAMSQPDLVVYTPAIPKDLSELNFFMTQTIPMKKRAEVLGIISRGMTCIAVAGTHGKTSTTCIVTHLLRTGGIDCTAFLGGIANNLGGNFVQGKSDWVVVEADEFDRSFMHLDPDIMVLNSLDPDHLDIYGSPQEVINSYHSFSKKIKKGGTFYYRNNLDIRDWKNDLTSQNIDIKGFDVKKHAPIYIGNISIENGQFTFDYFGKDITITNLFWNFPGEHNLANAAAAISIALQLGIQPDQIREGLISFKGVHRRFEWIIRNEKIVFIDDYAHHPAELEAAITAAKKLYPNKKVTGVFQPHLFSRTKDFADDFAHALDKLDELYLLPIYPARELPIDGVTSNLIFDKMKNKNKILVTKEELLERIKTHPHDVVMTLGAGDIDKLIAPIKIILE